MTCNSFYLNDLTSSIVVVVFPFMNSLCDTESSAFNSASTMTQLDEAVARYHRLLETEAVRTSDWLEKIRAQMAEQGLIVNGRPVTPVLRPHFISRRQYTNLMKTAELINGAIERVRTLALENPSLMARMEMLPAEKMLAQEIGRAHV